MNESGNHERELFGIPQGLARELYGGMPTSSVVEALCAYAQRFSHMEDLIDDIAIVMPHVLTNDHAGFISLQPPAADSLESIAHECMGAEVNSVGMRGEGTATDEGLLISVTRLCCGRLDDVWMGLLFSIANTIRNCFERKHQPKLQKLLSKMVESMVQCCPAENLICMLVLAEAVHVLGGQDTNVSAALQTRMRLWNDMASIRQWCARWQNDPKWFDELVYDPRPGSEYPASVREEILSRVAQHLKFE